MNRVLYQLSYAAMCGQMISAPPKSALLLYTQLFRLSSKNSSFFGYTSARRDGYAFLETICAVLHWWAGLYDPGIYLAGTKPRQYVPVGRLCFCIVGRLGKRLHPAAAELLGAVGITALELATGLLVNRNFAVWDYRATPLNYLGQICLPFTLLWVPVSLAATVLYRKAERLVK